MLFPSYLGTFTEEERWNAEKKEFTTQAMYVWINKFTPAKNILHNCWLWWLRHLEGLGPASYQAIILFFIVKMNKKAFKKTNKTFKKIVTDVWQTIKFFEIFQPGSSQLLILLWFLNRGPARY